MSLRPRVQHLPSTFLAVAVHSYSVARARAARTRDVATSRATTSSRSPDFSWKRDAAVLANKGMRRALTLFHWSLLDEDRWILEGSPDGVDAASITSRGDKRGESTRRAPFL